MRYFLLSLLGMLSLYPVYAQKRIVLTADEKKLDSARHYQRILITGEGSMQSRMFLDFLSDELIKDLKKQNIECKYEYLGNPNNTDIEESFKKAETWQHDAILRFSPLNAADKQVITKLSYGSSFNQGYSQVSRQYLVSNFTIVLNDDKETIWSARLYSAIEFGKNTVYKRIRKMIISDMEKKNVLPK